MSFQITLMNVALDRSGSRTGYLGNLSDSVKFLI